MRPLRKRQMPTQTSRWRRRRRRRHFKLCLNSWPTNKGASYMVPEWDGGCSSTWWATKPNRRQFVDSFACFEHSPRTRRRRWRWRWCRHPQRMLQILASDCGFGPTMPCAVPPLPPCLPRPLRCYLVVLAKNCSNHHLVRQLVSCGARG